MIIFSSYQKTGLNDVEPVEENVKDYFKTMLVYLFSIVPESEEKEMVSKKKLSLDLIMLTKRKVCGCFRDCRPSSPSSRSFS